MADEYLERTFSQRTRHCGCDQDTDHTRVHIRARDAGGEKLHFDRI